MPLINNIFTAGGKLALSNGGSATDFEITTDDNAKIKFDNKLIYTNNNTFTDDKEIVDKKYVDDAVAAGGGGSGSGFPLTQNESAGGFVITNLGTATNSGDALSLGTGDSRYLKLTSGTTQNITSDILHTGTFETSRLYATAGGSNDTVDIHSQSGIGKALEVHKIAGSGMAQQINNDGTGIGLEINHNTTANTQPALSINNATAGESIVAQASLNNVCKLTSTGSSNFGALIVEKTGSGIANVLTVNNSSTSSGAKGIFINNTSANTSHALDIDNNSSGRSINAVVRSGNSTANAQFTHNGSGNNVVITNATTAGDGINMSVSQNNTSHGITIAKSGSGSGNSIRINDSASGGGNALHIIKNNGSGGRALDVNLNSTATSSEAAYITNAGLSAGLYINNSNASNTAGGLYVNSNNASSHSVIITGTTKTTGSVIDCGNVGKIINLVNGSNAQDAAAFGQVSVKANTSDVVLRNGTQAMTGNLDLGTSNKIVNMAQGTLSTDAVRKDQLDLKSNITDVILRNGTNAMSGNLNMNTSNYIVNLADGVNSKDAVNKSQLDLKLDISSGNYVRTSGTNTINNTTSSQPSLRLEKNGVSGNVFDISDSNTGTNNDSMTITKNASGSGNALRIRRLAGSASGNCVYLSDETASTSGPCLRVEKNNNGNAILIDKLTGDSDACTISNNSGSSTWALRTIGSKGNAQINGVLEISQTGVDNGLSVVKSGNSNYALLVGDQASSAVATALFSKSNTSSTSPCIQIDNRSLGNCFEVYDQASDTSIFKIDHNGRVCIGQSASFSNDFDRFLVKGVNGNPDNVFACNEDGNIYMQMQGSSAFANFQQSGVSSKIRIQAKQNDATLIDSSTSSANHKIAFSVNNSVNSGCNIYAYERKFTIGDIGINDTAPAGTVSEIKKSTNTGIHGASDYHLNLSGAGSGGISVSDQGRIDFKDSTSTNRMRIEYNGTGSSRVLRFVNMSAGNTFLTMDDNTNMRTTANAERTLYSGQRFKLDITGNIRFRNFYWRGYLASARNVNSVANIYWFEGLTELDNTYPSGFSPYINNGAASRLRFPKANMLYHITLHIRMSDASSAAQEIEYQNSNDDSASWAALYGANTPTESWFPAANSNRKSHDVSWTYRTTTDTDAFRCLQNYATSGASDQIIKTVVSCYCIGFTDD